MAWTDLVQSLTTESQHQPLGIDIMKPSFNWKINSGRRGAKQTAYQIVVTENKEDAENEVNLVWDSGIVLTDRSIHIVYEGSELQSRRRYYWKVKVWNELEQSSPWSEISYWEMGLLAKADWIADWIEPQQEEAIQEEPVNMMEMFRGKYNDTPDNVTRLLPSQYVRCEFNAESEIKKARAYVTANGVYRLEINGTRVGDRELAPEFTSYAEYLQYQTYDVTDYIVEGENAIGAVLADGWYAGRISITGDSCQYGNRLGLLLQLEIEYGNGVTQTIVSDSNFRSSTGPLLYSDLFIGEKYDSREELSGWSLAGFDETNWKAVEVADYGYSNLVASYGEPVRVVQEFPATRLFCTPEGDTVVDVGQVIAGRARIRLRGTAGTEVVFEHCEVLDEHGNFMRNINGRNKDQKDIYILHGEEEEVYEPQFTFHGFRYVKISGHVGTISVDDVTAVVLSSDLRQTGNFICSDARINRLQQNIVWSQRANFLAIPTDCPQRERAGWTGDIQVFAPTAAYNMDVQSFLTRWLRNLTIEQREEGQVPNIVPWDRTARERDEASGNVSSAGWGDACIIVPWSLYRAYGDRRVLEEHYGTMVKWMEYVIRTAEQGVPEGFDTTTDFLATERQKWLWNTGFHFGDWLTPSLSLSLDGKNVNMMNSAIQTKELVATCFYAYSTQLMAQIASTLGRNDEAARYSECNSKVRQAFAEQYLQQDGNLGKPYQGVYVLALQFGMIPESMHRNVFDQLITLIEANDWKLDTGFMSIPFLMDVLCANGRSDVAYRLLFQTDCPSWLYEVDKGATTIWESWAAILPGGQVNRVSYNHYAFGCVGDWLYRRIAGLNKSEHGYKHILIEPDLECGLQFAEASHESLYGTISTRWEIKTDRFTLQVIIPVNTTATVILPNAAGSKVLESGIAVEEADGITEVKKERGNLRVLLGSGKYSFHYTRI